MKSTYCLLSLETLWTVSEVQKGSTLFGFSEYLEILTDFMLLHLEHLESHIAAPFALSLVARPVLKDFVNSELARY